MGEYLRPGVYIEEKAGAPAPILGVSTSNMAIVGFTTKGPINDPKLVTSYEQFTSIFGSFTDKSVVPLSMYAFFQNGGRRAYVVRVTAADAEEAVGYIGDAVTGEDAGTGPGVGPYTGTLANPPVPGSLAFAYYSLESVIDESTGSVADPQSFTLANTPIKPGSVSIDWEEGAVPKNATDDGLGVIAGDATGTINYVTGEVTIDFTVGPPDAAPEVDYDWYESHSVTDDGAGALTGDGTGTIDYDTGDYALTASVAVTGDVGWETVEAAYNQNLWTVQVKWPGDAGNDIRVAVRGNDEYANPGEGTFDRFDFIVQVWDDNAGAYVTEEVFDALDFTDSTSPNYFPTIVNDEYQGSDIVTIVEPGQDAVPASLQGTPVVGEDLGAATANMAGTLAAPAVEPRSVVITVQDALGTGIQTVTDDGNGNLIGDVNPTGTNSIDYVTGDYDVTFDETPLGGNGAADYVTAPVSEIDYAVMSGGSDGGAVTRAVVSNPSLAASELGMYALNQIDDILSLIIPDFAGDEIVAGDQLDYAELRKDRFVVLTTPEGMDPQEALEYKRITLGRNSDFGAIYYPWITVLDPLTDVAMNLPPLGHVAGIYARTDNNKSVGKAPAGKEDGALSFFIGLERRVSDGEMDLLYPAFINPIIFREQIGTAVWGARLLNATGEYRWVHVRRLMMYLEKSIFNATQNLVFENNGSDLWSRVRFQVGSFLQNQWSNRLLAGRSPSEGYFVICDESNNPPESVNAGFLYIDVGVAPNKPAEFVVFRFQLKTIGGGL